VPWQVFNETRFLSCLGVHQGDPVASLLLGIVLQPFSQRIQEECPDFLLNVWYLDDGVLVGTRETLQHALDILENDSPPLCLHLNRHKCLVCCGNEPSSANSVDPLPGIS
jgi:hypothetical protein